MVPPFKLEFVWGECARLFECVVLVAVCFVCGVSCKTVLFTIIQIIQKCIRRRVENLTSDVGMLTTYTVFDSSIRLGLYTSICRVFFCLFFYFMV